MLIVGANKSDLLRNLPGTFLFIDDSIDAIPASIRERATVLDFDRHSFNPLEDIDYKRARDFVSVLNAVFPEGENTLTRKASNFALLKALLTHPKRLDRLMLHPDRNDPGALDAYQKLQTLLLSPVLRSFLCNPRQHTNFSRDGTLLVRLDRSIFADFDCFVIANLLISNYRGQVVIPDYGFYACPFHSLLIREKRLSVGVNFLDEIPELKNSLLLIENKLARKCTAEDAERLAAYAGLVPGTNAHTDFIHKSIA
jgi:hypothetical protein